MIFKYVWIHVEIFSCNVPTHPEDQVTPKTPKDKQLKKQYNKAAHTVPHTHTLMTGTQISISNALLSSL